ncbi:MAG: 50S ribosomal protein L10 [Candidatus Woesearchaeota archaeon]|nr:50S ribosomal protein L10 [Candidatus Woesearchaeota archaeon]
MAATTYKAKASAEKQTTVKQLVGLFKKYPIVAAVNMENLPAPQLQKIRESLRADVVIFMAKRRLITLAIESVKKEKQGIEQLEQHLQGMPALMFTAKNPFTLYKTLQKNKSKAPAKAGQTAPNDIKVSAGATPFAPGPVIGELGSCGLKTGIEAGKVVIKEDKVVVKAGEVVSAKLAGLLARLGIEPMEIGLNVTAAYENGVIFTRDILGVDEKEYLDKINTAAQWALNLGVEAGIYTRDVVELMISKAFNDAKGLAVEQSILADMVVGDVLARVERQAAYLNQQIPQ